MQPATRRWFLLAYLVVLLSLIAGSTPRTVGDGDEYLAMAFGLGALGRPLSSAPAHFWFYPALAAPWVRLAGAIGLDPLAGFTVLNLLLLGGAFWVVSARLEWPFTVLLFAGPIVWWVDKGHTEVFSFSLLAIAVTLVREAPWWSMLCLGAASTQNPPFALLLPMVALLTLVTRRGRLDRRVWAGGAAAAALALLHPVYYQVQRGTAVPLAGPDFPILPNAGELGAVLLDLNLGLLPNFPALALVLGLSLVVLLARAPRRLWSAEAAIGAASAVILLFSVAQTSNLNHGGTRGLSRYAIWFMPLAIPLFRQLGATCRTAARRGVAPVAVLSGAWCLFAFHPGLPENHLTPTAVARLVWQRYPALENPPPEVFIERLRGRDGSWRVPVATPGCEKVLFAGRDDAGIWPIPCPVVRVPPRCRRPGALCYANRSGHGYDFVRVATPSFARELEFDRQAVWDQAGERTVRQLGEQFRWWELHLPPGPARGGMLRAEYGARAYAYQGPDRLLVFILDPAPGAILELRVPGPMIGEFIELETGRRLGTVLYTGEPWAAWSVVVPGAPASVALALHLTG